MMVGDEANGKTKAERAQLPRVRWTCLAAAARPPTPYTSMREKEVLRPMLEGTLAS